MRRQTLHQTYFDRAVAEGVLSVEIVRAEVLREDTVNPQHHLHSAVRGLDTQTTICIMAAHDAIISAADEGHFLVVTTHHLRPYHKLQPIFLDGECLGS